MKMNDIKQARNSPCYRGVYNGVVTVKPKFHLARHDTTCLSCLDETCRVMFILQQWVVRQTKMHNTTFY